jgi:hypothetical protein
VFASVISSDYEHLVTFISCTIPFSSSKYDQLAFQIKKQCYMGQIVQGNDTNQSSQVALLPEDDTNFQSNLDQQQQQQRWNPK